MPQSDSSSHEHELGAREADLAQREARALDEGGDPAVLAKLADERDALADERDDAADEREQAALSRRTAAQDRDARAAARDKRRRVEHDDGDPGFSDRFLSACDVDASAGDRAEALIDERHAGEDRRRSREDRHRGAADRQSAMHAAAAAADKAEAEQRHLRAAMDSGSIRAQAKGILMERHQVDGDGAFGMLVAASRASNRTLDEVADDLVRTGELPRS